MIEAFQTLESSPKEIGLVINANKINFMTINKSSNNRDEICFNVRVDRVSHVRYHEVQRWQMFHLIKPTCHIECQQHRCYFGPITRMRSRLMPRQQNALL